MLKFPVLIVNMKNYLEASGEKGVAMAKAAERVAKEFGVNIVVAPPTPILYSVASSVSIPVYAQHVDVVKAGSTTGFIPPEYVKSFGVCGSLINHSEHQLPVNRVKQTITLLKDLSMDTVVCAVDPKKAKVFAKMEPDAVAVEPPELIGTGIPVSKARPEAVTEALRLVEKINPRHPVLCGAGISTGEDVKKALELGTKGVLLASGVVKAKDPYKVLLDMAKACL